MKTKYIVLLVTGIVNMVFGSCTLNYDPISEYSELTQGYSNETGDVAYKNKAEAFSAYQGIYNLFSSRQEHWYLDLMMLAESHSDNAYGGTTSAQVVTVEDNSVGGSNSVLTRDWTRYLEDVAKVNKFINNIDSVPDATLTQNERNQWKAEAKIFRALVMFDMVRIWGNIPVITTTAGNITASNISETYKAYYPKQNTPTEAYTQIIKDLTEAVTYAPSTDKSDKTILTKDVAYAMLAKAYAEKPLQDYSKVIEYADKVTADGYDLEANYGDLFDVNADKTDCKLRNSKETILETHFTTGNGNWVTWMFGRDLLKWADNFTWAKWVTPSRDLIKAYDSEGDNIRKNQSIVYYSCTWSNYYPSSNYPFDYKIRSKANSIIRLRYADILLLRAEAEIMKGDLASAATNINKVRNRVGLASLTSDVVRSKDSMMEALLKERRLELAFEGQRWFDLCRFGKVESVMNAVFKTDSGRRALATPFTENSYYFPIPQNAIDQNSNLVQNPGY
jgi:hypothetical protein